jgi:hypothetical protein
MGVTSVCRTSDPLEGNQFHADLRMAWNKQQVPGNK